jgi:hypothetical protein
MSEDGVKPLPPKELKFLMFINPAQRRLLIYDRETSLYLGDLDVSEETLDKLCTPANVTTIKLASDERDPTVGAVLHAFQTGNTSSFIVARLNAQLNQDLE